MPSFASNINITEKKMRIMTKWFIHTISLFAMAFLTYRLEQAETTLSFTFLCLTHRLEFLLRKSYTSIFSFLV